MHTHSQLRATFYNLLKNDFLIFQKIEYIFTYSLVPDREHDNVMTQGVLSVSGLVLMGLPACPLSLDLFMCILAPQTSFSFSQHDKEGLLSYLPRLSLVHRQPHLLAQLPLHCKAVVKSLGRLEKPHFKVQTMHASFTIQWCGKQHARQFYVTSQTCVRFSKAQVTCYFLTHQL